MSDTTRTASENPLPVRTSKDPHSHIITGTVVIHRVLRRGMNTLLEQSGRVKTESQIRDFMAYAQLFSATLHHHHTHEDIAFFPILSKHFPEVATWSADHILLDQSLDLLNIQIASFSPPTSSSSSSSSSPTIKHVPYDGEAFASNIRQLQSQLLPHLQAEEDVMKRSDFRTIVPAEDCIEMDRIFAIESKKAVGTFGFFYAHQSPEDKKLMRLPWFLRWVVYPISWLLQRRALSFAPYA